MKVVILDQNGQGLRGREITFIAEGGGTLDGVSTKTVRTDLDGVATIDWKVAEVAGTQYLKATSKEVTGEVVTFTAIVTVTPEPEPEPETEPTDDGSTTPNPGTTSGDDTTAPVSE